LVERAALCPLCSHRKAKRACPAKGTLICSQCCGEKRRVEIDCPDDCVYLQGSHAPAWEGRETERRRDLRRLAPFVGRLSEKEAQLFFATLVGISEIEARRRALSDRTLAAAVAALLRSATTRSQGVIYEHAAEGLEAEAVVTDLKAFWKRLGSEEVLEIPELPKVLEALSKALAEGPREEGDRTFLETALRLVRRHGLALNTKEASPSSILIP
jgi:hypothetical protein